MNDNNKSSLEEMYKRTTNTNTINNQSINNTENVNDFQNEINSFNSSQVTSKPELIRDEEYKVESIDIGGGYDNTGTIDDEVLLNSFIGENYPKIKSEKFNIFAFLFSGVYLFYRKLFVVGIILQIIQVLLIMIAENYILLVIINVLLGFFFDRLYLYYAKYKIKKIKNENQDKSLNNLKFICSEIGGVSKKNIFIGILINLGILLVLSLFGFIMGIIPSLSGLADKINNTSEKTEKHDDAFDGTQYSENINIGNVFSINVPEVFSNKSSSYKYEYLYENSGNVFNDCKISIGEVSNYNDSDKFISSLVKYYESNSVSSVTNTKVNNISWNYFSYTGSFNTTYLYITNKNSKIYLLEYEIQNNAPTDCINYKDSIINSISFK